jgi:hypothetical protein
MLRGPTCGSVAHRHVEEARGGQVARVEQRLLQLQRPRGARHLQEVAQRQAGLSHQPVDMGLIEVIAIEIVIMIVI